MPASEVDDFEIYHIERQFFNGENAIKMVERLLGIDVKVNAIYSNKSNLGKRPNQIQNL